MAGPISIGETYDKTLVKFNRKEFSDLLSSDQERSGYGPSSGLRHRGAHSRSNIVAPSASSKPHTPTTVAWEDQQQSQYARSAEMVSYNEVSSCTLLSNAERIMEALGKEYPTLVRKSSLTVSFRKSR